MHAGGGVDVLWLLGADEFDTAAIGADTFVVYQGHHGDAGAAPRRRDPAGRGLHREIRHLCEHRRPGATRLHGASIRRAMRARTGRSCAPSAPSRPHAALRHDRGAARAAGAGQPGVRQRRLPAALRLLRHQRAGRRSGGVGATRRSRRAIEQLLPDRSDQPRQSRPWRPACGAAAHAARWRRNRRDDTHHFLHDTASALSS